MNTRRFLLILFAALAFTACSDDYDADTRIFFNKDLGTTIWYRCIPGARITYGNWENFGMLEDGRYVWANRIEDWSLEEGFWVIRGDFFRLTPIRTTHISEEAVPLKVEEMMHMTPGEPRMYRFEVHEGPYDGTQLDSLFLYEYIQEDNAYTDTPLIFIDTRRYKDR